MLVLHLVGGIFVLAVLGRVVGRGERGVRAKCGCITTPAAVHGEPHDEQSNHAKCTRENLPSAALGRDRPDRGSQVRAPSGARRQRARPPATRVTGAVLAVATPWMGVIPVQTGCPKPT